MRLMHPIFSAPLDFTESNSHTVVIESPDELYRMLKTLLAQIEGEPGDFIYSKDYEPVEIFKKIELITNPLHLDWSNRTLQNKLQRVLEKIAISEDHYLRTNRILSAIEAYGSVIIEDVALPVEMCNEIDLTKLIKLLEVTFITDTKCLAEELIEYIKLVKDMTDISCFMIVNISNFINNESLIEFQKNMEYEHINVLYLEAAFKEEVWKCPVRIYDKDLCEIELS